MGQFLQSTACTVGAVAIGASCTSADVTEYQVAKLHIYEQTTSAPPVGPPVYMIDSIIDMDEDDAASASVNGVSFSEDYPGEWAINHEFASQAELDAAFPGVVFNLHFEGGTLGVRDETLVLSLPALYPFPGAITPASFTASQGADPTQDLLIEWTTPGVNVSTIFLHIADVTNDFEIFDGDMSVLQTGYLIPASMLSPNSVYEVELVFGNASFGTGNPSPGFGESAVSIAGYATITAMSFTTGAVCDDVGFAGAVKIADYQQVADNTAPTIPFSYSFAAFTDTVVGGIATASVSGGVSVLSLDKYLPGSWDAESPEYTTQSELDAEFPSSTTYTIHLEGGTLGERDQGIMIGADDYPAVPYLISTGYSDLQSYNPETDLTVEWVTPSANVTHIFAEIYSITDDTTVLETQLSGDATGVSLAAGNLNADTDYEAIINFVAAPKVIADDCSGFGSETLLIGGYVSATIILFTTLSDNACLPDLNGDGFLNFFDISAFLMAFANADPIADFNSDGFFNFFDISAFLMEFSAGCP